MDRPGAGRALREATAAGAVAVVVVCCVFVAGLAIVSTLVTDLGMSSGTVCWSRVPPAEVSESVTGEGGGATASTSLVPFGARCTWTLPDGRTVSADPPWGVTLTVASAAGVAGGALGLLVRASRRSAARDSRRRAPTASQQSHI